MNKNATEQPIVFFDGECAFCDRIVQTLLALDDDELLAFAPLQGETAKANLPLSLREMEEPRTIVFLDAKGRRSIRSEAILEIARHLGGPYSLSLLAHLIPVSFRDACYDAVAKRRKRLLRSSSCSLPSASDAKRFLD